MQDPFDTSLIDLTFVEFFVYGLVAAFILCLGYLAVLYIYMRITGELD